MSNYPPHDLMVGERVRYVPGIAKGDPLHPACEDGIVRKIGSNNVVFVVYDSAFHGVAKTIEQTKNRTASGTDPRDLVRLTGEN